MAKKPSYTTRGDTISGKALAAQIGSGDEVALLFDKAKLCEYLKATKSQVVWIVFKDRHASVHFKTVGSHDLHQAWSWKGKKLSKIAELKRRYEDEDIDSFLDGEEEADPSSI